MKSYEETLFAIGGTEAKHACSPGATLTENLTAAMRAMKGHWLVTDEQQQFLCAVGGVMTFCGPDSAEWGRLEREVKNMKRLASMLTALQQGVPVDFVAMLKQVEVENTEGFEPIGLQKMWRDLK